MNLFEQDLLKIKAKAFDNLMEILKDKEVFHGYGSTIEQTNTFTSKITKYPIYEWNIRLAHTNDIRKNLLDFAAKDLLKEIQNASK